MSLSPKSQVMFAIGCRRAVRGLAQVLCSALTFTVFTESGSPICVSYASRTFLTVIGLLMQRWSLTRSDHATTVGPIRFLNRSNNCRVCKINERRSSLVRSHHAIFVVSASNKRRKSHGVCGVLLTPTFLAGLDSVS